MPNPVLDFAFNWKHLIDTDQVIATRSFLHAIIINRPDVGAGALISVYDVAEAGDISAATLVANITMDDAFFVVPVTLVYDVQLASGLYILFSAGMTTGDITVSYR